MPLFPNIQPEFYGEGAPYGVKPRFDNESLLGRMRCSARCATSRNQRATAAYYGMISHMDEWIGKIHEGMRTGFWDNTIVVPRRITGRVGQHGYLGKQNVYQHSMRVPLIAAGPGFGGGAHAGTALPAGSDPARRGRRGAGGAFLSLGTGAALRRLVRQVPALRATSATSWSAYNFDGRRKAELYDLLEDPWETNDLSAVAGLEPVLQGLRQRMAEWQRTCSDDAGWSRLD